MGVDYEVIACIKYARLEYTIDALVDSGIKTRSVTKVKGVHQIRSSRNIDLVRGSDDLSQVQLSVIVDSEDLAKKVVDLIKQYATTGHPRDDGWIKYTRRDNVEPITQEYPI